MPRRSRSAVFSSCTIVWANSRTAGWESASSESEVSRDAIDGEALSSSASLWSPWSSRSRSACCRSVSAAAKVRSIAPTIFSCMRSSTISGIHHGLSSRTRSRIICSFLTVVRSASRSPSSMKSW